MGIQAQIVGYVTDEKNQPLSYVNIYWEGSNLGTISNAEGYFEIEKTNEIKSALLVFKYIGYQTEKVDVSEYHEDTSINIMLKPQSLELQEVSVTANENPAIRVIRETIAHKPKQLKLREKYKANFYSKGFIKIKEAPKKILGQEVGDFNGSLDSSRSGVIYLSETLSKIYKNQTDFKETITASKVAGDAAGISFNNASDVDYDFYENTVLFGGNIISPIATNAFSYYKYRLEGTFYDGQKLINQIRVIPKRKDDRVFFGSIQIVEDTWELYGVDLKITGFQAKILPADTISLKQEFNYNQKYKTHLKALQRIDFGYRFFGFQGIGSFTAGYADYELDPKFEPNTFGKEILAFETNAIKKDSLFWSDKRPVPLTNEESISYQTKDSIEVIRKSKPYLDSIDNQKNKLKWANLIGSYTHNNSYEKREWTIETPLTNISYNTVQGWRGAINFYTIKQDEDRGVFKRFDIKSDYGISEKRLRPILKYFHQFNATNRRFIRILAGREILQFNRSEPITPMGNTIVTLLFENNFAKFFERDFAEINYGEQIANGVVLNTRLAFEQRNALFNNSSDAFVKTDKNQFTSNNPLLPFDFDIPAFENHSIWKFELNARIRFNEKYLSYPDGRYNYSDDRFPTLFLGMEHGIGGSTPNFNFSHFKARITQSLSIVDKGTLSYNIKGGKFVGGNDIAFVDYHHFNGNRTKVTRLGYLNSYFTLPYYERSANDAYFETHFQHNFEGFIMNRIPLLKKLKSHLIFNINTLATPNSKPHNEFGISLGNLGIGKFRFLRIGYAKSWFDSVIEETINFGIQF